MIGNRLRVRINENKSVRASSVAGLLANEDLMSFAVQGIWGRVEEVSGPNHVDVQLENGVVVEYVSVSSQAWVYTSSGRTSGSKNIPPKGSYVFLIVPGGEIERAFVLTSMPDQDVKDHTSDLVVEGEERKATDVTEAGWKTQYDKDTGNFKVTDLDDSGFELTIDKENGSITIKDWNGNNVTKDSNGITTTDTNGNEVVQDSSGITFTDANGNSITLDSTGATVSDINENKITMDTGGITLQTGDASPWVPNVLPTDPLTGTSHSSIARLKGA